MDAVRSLQPAATVRDVEWFHCLFVRDGRVISCGVDARGDGVFSVNVVRLGVADGHVSEVFMEPADAFRRHAEICRHLQASGWLVASGGLVQPAA